MGTIGGFPVNALLVGWLLGMLTFGALFLFCAWLGRLLENAHRRYPKREDVERARAGLALGDRGAA